MQSNRKIAKNLFIVRIVLLIFKLTEIKKADTNSSSFRTIRLISVLIFQCTIILSHPFKLFIVLIFGLLEPFLTSLHIAKDQLNEYL